MQLREAKSFGTAEADNDDLLLACFEDHEAYIAAKNHSKFLIVGRKGSGKTAIFRKLNSERDWNQFSHGHSFSDYPWFHHDKQKKSGVPESECFRYSWEYVILISLARIILNDANNPWSIESLESMAILEEFVVDTYGTKKPELNTVFSPNIRIKVKGSAGFNFLGLNASISGESVEVAHFPLVIYEVNQALANIVIKCLNPELSYHVCFDELDRGFTVSDVNYRLRLAGLLIAARDFNRRLRVVGKKASVIIFLRDDILRYLKFEDKNKIVEDSSQLIEWDKRSTSRTLKNLMERRFSKVLDIPAEGAWEAVFDEERLMTGKQQKYQYILDRTFKRPRDIIKFTNEILRSYQQDGAKSEKFLNKDVMSAREEHSKYMRKELVDELNQHVPDEEFVFSVIRVIGSVSFTLDKFRESYAEFAKMRAVSMSIGDALKEFYNFSVIGYLKVGGSRGGSEWVWRYEDTEAEYDERATVFRVHSGLKEFLGLKNGRAVGSQEMQPALAEGEVVDDGDA